MTTLPPWVYKSTIVNELPKDCYGFIYRITYDNGMTYFGKKKTISTTTMQCLKDGSSRDGGVFFNKRVKLTKEELSERKSSDKRVSKLVQFERVTKATKTWVRYCGSSEDTPDKEHIVKRDMLYFSSNKMTLTYLEDYVLYKTNAIPNKKCYNKNISGRVFDNCLDGFISPKTIKFT